MNKFNVEFGVGIFVIMGVAAVAWLSVAVGGAGMLGNDYYPLVARFESSSGLKESAFVEMAGVRVGEVKEIVFDYENYESVVTIMVRNDLKLPDDAVASIRTSGIIGDKFIKLSAGGSEELLQPGDEFLDTESSISIEELVSKYIFNN